MARLGVSDPARNGGDVRFKLAPENDALEPQLYEHVHELTGDFDVLFIGMECDGAPLSWVYGALLIKPLARKLDQARRLTDQIAKKVSIWSTL